MDGGSTLVLAHVTTADCLSRWQQHPNKIEGTPTKKACTTTDSLPIIAANKSVPPPNPNSGRIYANDDDDGVKYEEYELWRVFYCDDGGDDGGVTENEILALRAFRIEKSAKGSTSSTTDTPTTSIGIEVRGLAMGAWRQLNRNVPSHLNFTTTTTTTDDDNEEAVLPPRFVAVARRRPPWQGPIAVLVGLKYAGNIGAIIRSAVQANVFQAVYVIEERGSRTETTPLFTKTWGESDTNNNNNNNNNNKKGKEKSVSDKDISYYSMWNAPLIEVRRFQTVRQFLEAAAGEEDNDTNGINNNNNHNHRRATVCLDIGCGSFSLYSKEAIALFQSPAGKIMYLVIGAEDTGCPNKIIECATALLEIPAMSASINVSSAFTACLSTFMLCNSGALDS